MPPPQTLWAAQGEEARGLVNREIRDVNAIKRLLIIVWTRLSEGILFIYFCCGWNEIMMHFTRATGCRSVIDTERHLTLNDLSISFEDGDQLN